MTPAIVIPAHDEAASIGDVVLAARAHGRVLVVDDGSTDGTAERARAAGAEVVRHARRLGKAQAIRTGVAAARTRGTSLVVTLDGDGQHDPDDVPVVLAAAAASPDAIVVGCRKADDVALPPARRDAVRVASFFVSWITGQRVSDSQSGFRAYPMALLADAVTRRGGFVFETEILIAAAARGWRIAEVPVSARPRAGARSRFRPLADGAAITVYLAGHVIARWGADVAAAGGAVARCFGADRRRARHAAMLEAAAAAGGTLERAGAALTTVAARHAAARLRHWRDYPRTRAAARAAAATLAAPAALALILLQTLAAGRLPDVAGPLVRRLYTPERLDAPPARAPHSRSADAYAGEPVTRR